MKRYFLFATASIAAAIVIAVVLVSHLHQARAGGQVISPNLQNCVPVPALAALPTVDGSQWAMITSGSGSQGNPNSPGLLCIGTDYRPYVLACRLSGGACTGMPTFINVGNCSSPGNCWGTAW